MFSSVVFVVFLSIILSGCARNAETSSTQKGTAQSSPVEKIEALAVNTASAETGEDNVIADEVSIALGYDLSDLEPWTNASAGRNKVLPLLYEYMAYYDSAAKSGMSGILMKRYENVDALTSRVHIREVVVCPLTIITYSE